MVKLANLLSHRDPVAQERRRLKRELRGEADYFAATITRRLTQLGICYRYPKNRKDTFDRGVQRIRFHRAVGTPEGIYLMIDTMRLPRGTKLGDLNNDEILQDLSVVCRRPVRFKYGTREGAWFIVERKSGVWGVPRSLAFGQTVENWPVKLKKELVIPLGVGENQRLFYRSLAEFPHALVGGATGAGKTTFLHTWICSLIQHNTPAQVRLALVDLKGGIEFTRYKEIPHMMDAEMLGDEFKEGGFIKKGGDVVPMLDYMRHEVDRRLAMFERAGGIQNLTVWNYYHPKLPRLILFVDELAVIMLDSGLKKKAEPLLADISARGRAPGVHVVLATQRPEVKVVSGLIKANLDARFAFRVTDNTSSIIILDTVEAAKFDDSTPVGRYIYRRGLEKVEVQAPLITAGQIKKVIKDVMGGGGNGTGKHQAIARMSPEEIFRVAIRQLDGNFSIRKVYDTLERRVSLAYIRELGQEYEGEIVEVDGELYQLHPSSGGNDPRQFVLLEDGVGCSEKC